MKLIEIIDQYDEVWHVNPDHIAAIKIIPDSPDLLILSIDDNDGRPLRIYTKTTCEEILDMANGKDEA